MERATVYIDGFNFYYCLRAMKKVNPIWKKYYWIDFVKLFGQFLGPNQSLEKVVYFTASPLSASKSSRQSALFNANRAINGSKFVLVRGKYKNKTYACPNCGFSINKPEEKKTDVNLAIRMIEDCYLDRTDVIILVTADSDLVPPLEMICRDFPSKKIRLYFPPSGYSIDLMESIRACKGKTVYLKKNQTKFENSIMPEVVHETRSKKTHHIPPKWKT